MDWKEAIKRDAIIFWPFDTAPEELKALSQNGGDEDWIVICSPTMENHSIVIRTCGYIDSDGRFEPVTGYGGIGICSVDRYEYEGAVIFIGAHA